MARVVGERALFHRCDQCGAQYRLQRSPYAPLLESEAVCLAASALLLAALVGVCALVPGRPERLLYRLGEWHPAVWYRWWRPWMDRSVRGVALPGAFGFALSVREQLILHRGIPLTQQGWLSALVLTVATNGARIARVFVACGIVYFCSWRRAYAPRRGARSRSSRACSIGTWWWRDNSQRWIARGRCSQLLIHTRHDSRVDSPAE